MADNNLNAENPEVETKPQIHVNDLGSTIDPTVVVEEKDRTVLLTENETIIIPKETMIDVPPKNRARKVYAGMWGTTELVTVGLGLLAILTTILLFVFLVIPAQKELSDNRAKRDELDKQRETSQRRNGTITDTTKRVKELTDSANDFEARFLTTETNGRTALYQQINGYIAAYGLTNTSGPDYAPLEIVDQNRNNQQQSEEEKGRSKFMSIYPGVYVSMTLDGSYQNLRRFIREIETGNQFVVISSIELEPSENKETQDNNQTAPAQVAVKNPPPGQTGNPNSPNQFGAGNPNFQQPYTQQQTATKVDRGKTHGETVTLRLELAAYFRRPNVVQPQAVKTSVQQ
jgi:Tfp pilus assembly protein PilO